MNFRPGDHLVAQRIPIQHHGIYIGNKRVIDFSKVSGKNVVRERSLDNFRGSSPIWVFDYTDPENIRKLNGATTTKRYRLSKIQPLPRRIICFRAESQVREINYDFTDRNCEHFAHWCAIGSHISVQSDWVKDIFHLGEREDEDHWHDTMLLVSSRENRFKAYIFQNIDRWDYETLKFVEEFFYREYCDLVPTSTILRIKQEAGKWDYPHLWQK